MPGNQTDKNLAKECNSQFAQLESAFQQRGMAISAVAWREAAAVADRYAAMLPLFVWDYFSGNEQAFAEQMAKADSATVVVNSVPTLLWNANKRYLNDLSQRGAPVIDTVIVDKVDEMQVRLAFEKLDTEKLVIKPLVGGGAWRQVLYEANTPFPSANSLPPGEAMIQAFLPSVVAEGEYSFLYFGGKYSHGLVKRAASGDYRIQSTYGGTEEHYSPTDEEKSTALSILRSLPEMPAYARVDLLRGTDGQLKLIELELIEPFMYLSFADETDGINGGAALLADELVTRLN